MDSSSFRSAARQAVEIRVVLTHDGDETRTPIWIVTDGESVFVRSYRAEEGHWYQQVRRERRAVIELDGDDVEVRAEPVSDPVVLAAVSDAYLDKYAGQPETPDMVSPAVVATTLELVPAVADSA